jgi:sugar phosphate isomerase/epimerase
MHFGAMNYPVRPLEEEIRTVASLGFDFLELSMDPPGAHVDDLRKGVASIRQGLADAGLGLVCHLPTFVSTADLSPRLRAASREECAVALEVASELGARRVVLHPSFFIGLGRHVPELSQRLATECLWELLPKGSALGLDVCLENMFSDGGWLSTAEDFAPVMETFPELRIALDMGHAHIRGGSDCALAFLRRYASRIGHLHVSDNWGQRDDHLPLGAGNLRIRPILAELKRMRSEAWVTFEIFSPDRDYLRISREKYVRHWGEV